MLKDTNNMSESVDLGALKEVIQDAKRYSLGKLKEKIRRLGFG
jgi:hypothetical protein